MKTMGDLEVKIKNFVENERRFIRDVEEPRKNKIKRYFGSTDLNKIKHNIIEFYDKTALHHEADVVKAGGKTCLLAISQYLFMNPNIKNFVDAGCGVGLDICCLAQLFPNRYFIGYDISKMVLNLAEKRKLRLGLNNISFARADHDSLALQNIDMIYTTDILNEKMFVPLEERYPINKDLIYLQENRIKSFRSALKNNGIYAFILDIYPVMCGKSRDKYWHEITDFHKKMGFLVDKSAQIAKDKSVDVLVFMRKIEIEYKHGKHRK